MLGSNVFKISLYGKSRVKLWTGCNMYFVFVILLAINAFSDFRLIIEILSIVLFIPVLILGIYTFFDTKNKLVFANLNLGFQFILITIGLVTVFLQIAKNYYIIAPIYIIVGFLMGLVIYKKRAFEKKKAKKEHTLAGLGVIIGMSIGKGFVKDLGIHNIFVEYLAFLSFLTISLLMMYLGITLLCKSIYIIKYEKIGGFYLDFIEDK